MGITYNVLTLISIWATKVGLQYSSSEKTVASFFMKDSKNWNTFGHINKQGCHSHRVSSPPGHSGRRKTPAISSHQTAHSLWWAPRDLRMWKTQNTAPDSLKVKVKSLSHVWLFAAPWTISYQAPLSMGFSRQEYQSRLPFPSPGNLPNPGIEPVSRVSCIGRQVLYH